MAALYILVSNMSIICIIKLDYNNTYFYYFFEYKKRYQKYMVGNTKKNKYNCNK